MQVGIIDGPVEFKTGLQGVTDLLYTEDYTTANTITLNLRLA